MASLKDFKDKIKPNKDTSNENESANNFPPDHDGFAAFQEIFNNTSGGSSSPHQSYSPRHDKIALEHLINYNDRAIQGEIEPVLFRETQINQLCSVLTTKNHPNAILIGDAGTGKTAIVEELARRIATDDPIAKELFEGATIYELPLNTLTGGKGIMGQLEETLDMIINFATNPANKAILFIDEVHQLLSRSNPFMSIVSQMLKPALSRSNLHVIGATTTQEATAFLSDPAFSRRWSDIIVPELSPEQAEVVIRNALPRLHAHHGVHVPDKLLPQIVAVADDNAKYGSHRPDSTLTLLDRAMADEKLAYLQYRHEVNGEANGTVIPELHAEQIEKSAMTLLVGDDKKQGESTSELETNLEKNIISQAEAKSEIVNALKRKELRLVRQTKPMSFLFAGASGNGKTEIAKQLAKSLFGKEDAFIYVNMTEYDSSMTMTRLLGSTDGFVGSDSKRELPFDSLESNPFQIILLDEFEKAHRSIKQLFMQALDEGHIKNNRNKVIDFSRAIIIATTNAGMEDMAAHNIGFTEGETQKGLIANKEDIHNILKRSFKTELLNRFNHIIMFDSLTKDDYIKVLAVKYNKIVAEASLNRNDLKLLPPAINIENAMQIPELKALADETYNPLSNARPAEGAIRKMIEDTLLANPTLTEIQLLQQ